VQAQPSGALVRGIDLTQPLTREQNAEVRSAWLAHQVLGFPDQPLSVPDLERFALTIGPYGPDPYFESIPGHPHVAQVKREADETSTLFADNWHSDWSFLANPPAGTLLYGDVIPPIGGDTLFANQYAAYDGLDDAMKRRIEPLFAIHHYGNRNDTDEASRTAASLLTAEQQAKMPLVTHPIVRRHPVTGRKALYAVSGSSFGIVGMPDNESVALLDQLAAHATRPEFCYRHGYHVGDVVIWDNASLLHSATLTDPAYPRTLWRITIKEPALRSAG
jgi:taurine dioxygenase